MYNDFDLIKIKPKLNKKKIVITILIVLLIIFISIFSAVKFAEFKHKKEYEKALQIENERILEEKRIEEERIAEQQRLEEQQKQKNAKPFNEEQLQAFNNIYKSEEKRVFLTFDDGPTQTVTPLILDLLKQENIKATFFVLGTRAKANSNLIKREFDEGHYIANHGYTHKYSQIYQNSQTVLDEYNYTEKCIQEALQNPDYHSKVFRFPGGSNGGYYHTIKQQAKDYLKQNGIVSLDWNALSKDADGSKTKELIMQNVIQTVGEKQSVVLLMHDATDKILTYETLPDIIQYLREKGYVFKSLYDIL